MGQANMDHTYENIDKVKRVLLVGEHTVASAILAQQLQKNHYLVVQAYSYTRAIELIKVYRYDLVLLDEQLPNMDSGVFCTVVRAQCVCPIIFMSDCDDTACIVTALQNGGDDYMIKPIDCNELLARAQAIRRRMCQKEKESDTLKNFRSFTINLTHRNVVRNGQIIELTPIECALLLCLTKHPDTLLPYQELYEQVWRCDSLGDIRTIMVHISNLRKKLDPENEGLISTVRGGGYIFSDR